MQLPPAVPAFQSDIDTAHAELGKMIVYIKQLTDVILERAAEANELHDQLLAARARIAELESRTAILSE